MIGSKCFFGTKINAQSEVIHHKGRLAEKVTYRLKAWITTKNLLML
jgi:hypothetical protein